MLFTKEIFNLKCILIEIVNKIWVSYILVCQKSIKRTFKSSFWVQNHLLYLCFCVVILWIHKSYCVIKKLVWNVRIKAFWYTIYYYYYCWNILNANVNIFGDKYYMNILNICKYKYLYWTKHKIYLSIYLFIYLYIHLSILGFFIIQHKSKLTYDILFWC